MNSIRDKSKKDPCRKGFGIFTLVYCGMAMFSAFNKRYLYLAGTGFLLNSIWIECIYYFMLFTGFYVFADFFFLSRIRSQARYPVIAIIIVVFLIHLNSFVVNKRNECMGQGLFRYSPTLGWDLWPGIQGDVYKTNSLGFRSPEIEIKKEADQLRIIILGDSVTFGDDVKNAQLFSYQLQDLICMKFPNKNIEIINCGISGYNLLQSERLMYERGWKLEPDMIVIVYNFSSPFRTDIIRDPRPNLLVRPVFSLICKTGLFHERMEIQKYFYRDYYKIQGLMVPFSRGNAFAIGEKSSVDSFVKLLENCEKRGVKVVLYNRIPSGDFDKNFRRLADKHNALCFGMSKEWENKNSGLFFKDNIHFSEKGHRRFAENLMEYLKGTDLLNE